MKLQSIKKAFTLIELLVVITIIGILATGATTVYTGQIQKARDTTRINDVLALENAAEQVYQDNAEYPHADTFATEMNVYIKSLPKDSKHAQPCNNSAAAASAPDCGYAYISGVDANNIAYGDYEFSTGFENEGNTTKKAALDGGGPGVELNRYEKGSDIVGNVTAIVVDGITAAGNGACQLTSVAAATAGTDVIVINGNPGVLASQCD